MLRRDCSTGLLEQRVHCFCSVLHPAMPSETRVQQKGCAVVLLHRAYCYPLPPRCGAASAEVLREIQVLEGYEAVAASSGNRSEQVSKLGRWRDVLQVLYDQLGRVHQSSQLVFLTIHHRAYALSLSSSLSSFPGSRLCMHHV